MIPKVIHYCWFGGKPLSRLNERCLASWKQFMPDYEIKLWDESNFDVNCIPYVAEAYKAGKYAFVSDYARTWIIYNYGGIYLDTDVEVIKPFDDIVDAGPFMACENRPQPNRPLYVALGLGFGCEPHHPFLKEFMESYRHKHFVNADGSYNMVTVVERFTELLERHGLQRVDGIQEIGGVRIYPKDYFCPIDTHGQALTITERTRTIHHYAGSWSTPWRRFKKRMAHRLGPSFSLTVINLKAKLLKPFRKTTKR